MDPVFSGNDLRLIEGLVYDPNLEPSYEFLKGCLIWTDERPDGLTPAAYDSLCSLWMARGLLHRGFNLSDDPIDPAFTKDLWERAIRQVPQWPGFRRLDIGEKDRNYLQSMLGGKGEF